MHTPCSRFALWSLLALLPLLAACDVATSNTFDLPERRIIFEFVFQGGNLDPTRLNEVTSLNEVNLRSYIEEQNFTTADVVAARIRPGSARLSVARPLAANVSHFTRAEMRTFQGTTAGVTLVGGQGFTGTGQNATLEVRVGDFGNVVATGPFRAQLLVQPTAGAILDQEYVVEVTLDVVIEVEG